MLFLKKKLFFKEFYGPHATGYTAERGAALACMGEMNAHTNVLKNTTIYVPVNSTIVNALVSPLNSFQDDSAEIF
jgi:hypothetical protein